MEKDNTSQTKQKRSLENSNNTGGAVYALGFLGALIYFIQVAEGFGDGAIGLLKAIFWPAFLVFELFMYIGA